MRVLILVEHDNLRMHESTRHVLTAAKQLDAKPVLLVAGYQCQAVANQAAKLAGVDAVWLVDDEVYAHQMPENMASMISALSASFSSILLPSSTFGKNIAPRIAALLDSAQVSEVSKIINPKTFEHPIYAGNAIETLEILDDTVVLTIRCTAFDPAPDSDEPCCIELISPNATQILSQFIDHQLNQSTRPELGNAKIVVSGGRGVQSAENFKLIEDLADTLQAAVGASRAAVDAGFVPNDYQVGQTGKIVAPALYIAIGISGAVQHLAGMKDSKVIVAINKDPDASIFQIANYGLVGDLFDIVPQLIQRLKK